jgi:protein gp37
VEEEIDQVFAAMALAPWHTYQILTKRPERMREYVDDLHHNRRREAGAAIDLSSTAAGMMATVGAMAEGWPFVWLGVSVEDQKTADERIPLLLRTPAAVRFISAEPLLGPLRLSDSDALWSGVELADGARWTGTGGKIDWVIAGAESGPGARPMDEDWVRSLRDQCQAAKVPFFLKQSVDARGRKVSLPLLDGLQWAEFPGNPR